MSAKRRKTVRTKRAIIHVLANCRDCSWCVEWYLTAARQASRHVASTGHTVSVEQGMVYEVKPREGE